MAADPARQAQAVLEPALLRPAAAEAARLQERAAELSALGFVLEEFGSGALLVRGAPLRILIVEAGEADDATLRALRAGIRAVPDELTAALLLTPRDVAAGDGWTVYRAEARPVAAGPSA